MRHQNSVLHGLLKHVPWAAFDRLVSEHDADARVRRLPTKAQFIALLYGQLAGAASLREIETALSSHAARLYHAGGSAVARSTLADANASRPAELFAALLARMMAQAGGGLRRTVGEAVRLIDATGIRLAGLGSEWARFSAQACGAKLHVVYDPDADRPLYAAVSAARVNDITVAKAMPVEPGATYVFDLGYYDYGWWAKLDAAGCRIVTRFKKNTPLHLIEENHVEAGSPVLSDRIGLLPSRQAANRRNPFSDPVREITVNTDTGRRLRILTNDLDAPAEAIAALYKRRWAIELFFRWVKQTLKIRHFIGRSENAVRIQIAVALIAFLLLSLARASAKLDIPPLAFARLLRANLMHRRTLDRLLAPPKPIQYDPRQHAFHLDTA
jgi:predicted HTH domain antitoxin